jgi:hypothetical protein
VKTFYSTLGGAPGVVQVRSRNTKCGFPEYGLNQKRLTCRIPSALDFLSRNATLKILSRAAALLLRSPDIAVGDAPKKSCNAEGN